MTVPDEWELAMRALDAHAPESERIAAIDELGRSGSAGALSPLLRLGERESEPSAILRATGLALAALAHRDAHISEFDLRDLLAPAFEAFCEWEP